MADHPETRNSLIVRLKDRSDEAAWSEFVEVYQPVVYRLARCKGLQHADAEDLVQQVLSAVAAAVHRWQPDPRRGRFRAWLHQIARNLSLNMLTRGAPDRAAGGAESLDALATTEAPDGADSRLIRVEYRREVFHWAARQIQAELSADAWAAFWLTAVEGQTIDEVAARLGKTPGAVYAARGRIMRRLKEKVLNWEGAQ